MGMLSAGHTCRTTVCAIRIWRIGARRPFPALSNVFSESVNESVKPESSLSGSGRLLNVAMMLMAYSFAIVTAGMMK